MPVIAALGPVTFDVVRSPLMSWDRAGDVRYAEKPVLGARPPLEWIGEGGKSINLRVKLHPRKFGGLWAYEALEAIRIAGAPVFLMAGSGVPMGWVVIEKLSDRHTYLDATGTGQVVEVDISLKADGPPSAGSYFSIMTAFNVVGSLVNGIVNGIGARLL